MNVKIETIGNEDSHYDTEVTIVSLEQSFNEVALRLQLAGGVKIGDAPILIVDGTRGDMGKSLLEAFERIEIQPAQQEDYWYESGKKVAQWKRETQYTRQKKK